MMSLEARREQQMKASGKQGPAPRGQGGGKQGGLGRLGEDPARAARHAERLSKLKESTSSMSSSDSLLMLGPSPRGSNSNKALIDAAAASKGWT